MRPVLRFVCLALPALAGMVHAATPQQWVKRAIGQACTDPPPGLATMAAAIGDVETSSEEPLAPRGAEIGWRRTFRLKSGELAVQRTAPGGQLRRVSAQYSTIRNGAKQPELLAVATGDCAIQTARRLTYDKNGAAETIVALDADFRPRGEPEPLNPPVPAGEDAGGVPVALLDSGVNYLLPEIAARLARDDKGAILGYDFWDMDDRPFDANPARSAFFPQRHGTQTASVLLDEAPVARLVPYRYPRPDMSRMPALIEDAASKGVVVFNLSLGSDKPEEWQAFAQAARQHPEMLFVVSAGNDNRDIDREPVYPAALMLDNAITVTSSLPHGEPAGGANWGARGVDLLVPAENMLVTDFYGRPKLVSGSSYAAPRVSALAACLLAENPLWRAAELKQAIFAAAQMPSDGSPWVARGFLDDPDAARRGACPAATTGARLVSSRVFAQADLYADAPQRSGRFALRLTLALIEDSGWTVGDIRPAVAEAARVLAQCDIVVASATLHGLETGKMLQFFHVQTARELSREVPLSRPSVYFVKDTLQDIAYGAQAIGRSNTRDVELRDTVWMTRDVEDPGISLAHELVHMLTDSGKHSPNPRNLMHESTTPGHDALTIDQCESITSMGSRNVLLTPLADRPGAQ